MNFSSSQARPRGEVLISLIIAIAVLGILSQALFTLVGSSFRLVGFSRARISARHLAQEKMESIRNMGYSVVGTVGGIPDGELEQEEIVELNGLAFLIKTNVIYIDDPFDSLAPTDPIATDYKQVRVEVSWEGANASRANPVVYSTYMAPITEPITAGGVLSIQVIDAEAQPISGAQVTIFSDTVTPNVNTTQTTNATGKISLPGATPCFECYRISVTKSGYSTDKTYTASEVANPTKPYLSVFLGLITSTSFTIDRVSTLNIASVAKQDELFVPLGEVGLRLRGNKIIGTTTAGQPVYKYDQSLSTDAGGSLSLSDMEWDSYTIIMPDPSDRSLSATSPFLPFSLLPGTTFDMTFATEAFSTHSLFISAKNPAQEPIEAAEVRIYDDSGFEEIKTTGLLIDPDAGQLLFSNLEEKTYHLEVIATDHITKNLDVIVTGTTKEEIILTPN